VLVVAPPSLGPDIGAAPELRREVVAGHVRSLLVAGHLMDVGSSDRHTVKPWFAGRLDFSPPVPDLADVGFPLAGGRLDYLDGRTVAALVYRRRDHVINVFVWPEAAAGPPTAPRRMDASTARDGGHAVVRWTEGGMAFWAVSDLNAAELADFAAMFNARARDPVSPS
ncbi:MAG: anti-sigma factor, partial [Acetobacteraceae bacterium]|nr:anti-sigma factor [Acetobacteraceae bacterium]